MIDLVISRNNVYVWSAEDWLKLRRDHRIVGELIGCLPKHPRQDILSGLPLLLQAEEVSLLVEKRFARVIRYACIQNPPSECLRKTFQEYRSSLYIEQEECLRDERRKQVTTMMDKIVEGKKRKILGIEKSKKKSKKPLEAKEQEAFDNIEIDREELLEEEMAKLQKLDKNDALVQTHTAYPWSKEEEIEVVTWNYPCNLEQKLRYHTFKDLWEKGYYVTSGEKFGGDFLAYPGDPIMFHSQFIIQCKERHEEIPIAELAGECRVACHVRKTRVYAFLSNDGENVQYQSFQWAESNLP